MAIARPKEGPRAPLFYGALALALSALASAQTVEYSALERCAGLETEALRLACFEALVPKSPATPTAEAEPVAPVDPAGQAPASSENPAAVSKPTETRTADDEFGRDHLRDRVPGEPEVMNARVVDVSRNRYGALIFRLDNGQVWRQMEPRYFPYPKDREFDVEISTGMMGEYRLQVEGAGRKVTIRRTQ